MKNERMVKNQPGSWKLAGVKGNPGPVAALNRRATAPPNPIVLAVTSWISERLLCYKCFSA